jgi:hypothetical protein
VADSAAYSFIEPPTVDAPAVKVSVVGVPSVTAAAVLFVTVGSVTGESEPLAPLKVIACAPVYPVATFP